MIEKVNPSHPDKIADRIAGALVDYAYSVQSNPRIAVEALVGHRICHIIAETSVHIPATFVQDTVTRIAGEGVVMDYCEVQQDAQGLRRKLHRHPDPEHRVAGRDHQGEQKEHPGAVY